MGSLRSILHPTGSKLFLALLFTGPLWWLLSRPNQPTYQGIPLESWVEMYHNPYKQELARGMSPLMRLRHAREAIKHIGTNAVPCLLERLCETRSTWKEAAARRLAFALSKAPRQMVPYQWYAAVERYATQLEDRARDRPLQYCEAFAALEGEATPFIPRLMEIANNTRSPRKANDAALALGYIGTNAIPALIQLLNTPGHPCRDTVVQVFADFSTITDHAGPAVPALVQCLDDNNTGTIYLAARALAQIETDSPDVVPALARTLHHPEGDIRAASAEALAHFGPAAQQTLPALLDALTDTETEVRRDAAQAIEKIAPGETLWLAASNTIHSPDPELRAWAVRGLGLSGRGKSNQVALLLESLADPEPWVRTVANTWLTGIAPQLLTNAPSH